MSEDESSKDGWDSIMLTDRPIKEVMPKLRRWRAEVLIFAKPDGASQPRHIKIIDF
jgi:hypothetical protein